MLLIGFDCLYFYLSFSIDYPLRIANQPIIGTNKEDFIPNNIGDEGTRTFL